jgi:hypothetical protein
MAGVSLSKAPEKQSYAVEEPLEESALFNSMIRKQGNAP